MQSSSKRSEDSISRSKNDENIAETYQSQLEKSSKGQIKGNILWLYLRAGASTPILVALLFVFVVAQIVSSAADKWVQYWIKQEELRNNHAAAESISTNDCIIIHGGIILTLMIFAFTRSFKYFHIVVRASQKLHDIMFSGIISTDIKFFNSNSSGRILNRFTKDIGAIDENLSKAVVDTLHIGLQVSGAIIMAVIVNKLFLIPTFILSFLFIFVRKIYLKASKNIKRLEQISKSN